MVKKYPEVMYTDYEGRQHRFGQRHNACPNSLVYRKYARALADKLAERYASNPHVTCWHVNNEYGITCFCDNCQNAFRVWLKDKYKTIDALNKAWNMEFWGHTVCDWDDVVVPNALSEGIGTEKTAFAGISIDYRRFNSDSVLECYKIERDAIRSHNADVVITTNLMGTFKDLDYFKWAKEMDIVSWDNYPAYNTPWSLTAMRHDLMRGLKNAPFMLMGADAESAELAALQLPEAPRPDAGPELADCRSRRGYDPVLPAEEKPRSLREIPRRSHQPRGNRGHESFPGSAGAGKRAGGFKRPDPRQLERVKSGHHF